MRMARISTTTSSSTRVKPLRARRADLTYRFICMLLRNRRSSVARRPCSFVLKEGRPVALRLALSSGLPLSIAKDFLDDKRDQGIVAHPCSRVFQWDYARLRGNYSL